MNLQQGDTFKPGRESGILKAPVPAQLFFYQTARTCFCSSMDTGLSLDLTRLPVSTWALKFSPCSAWSKSSSRTAVLAYTAVDGALASKRHQVGRARHAGVAVWVPGFTLQQ